MATWSEYFWGPSTPQTTPPPTPDIDNLPEYKTFNGLAPEFQLSPEHDPDHIFPRELELIEQLRSQVPEAEHWPKRFLLIFLFARRHSVPHTIKLLVKHIDFLKSLGLNCKISSDNLYPFTPQSMSDLELQYGILEGPLLYKHTLVDKHNRLLQIVRPRNWIQGRLEVKKLISVVLWWYYYSWQHVPLSIHRNGMAVLIDMTNMGWANMDFSTDIQHFITNALTSFPGRMRQAWIINPNWILSTALSLLKLVLSAKVMSRMMPLSQEAIIDEIDLDYVPKDLGGNWDVDVRKEWVEKVFELDREAQEEKKKLN